MGVILKIYAIYQETMNLGDKDKIVSFMKRRKLAIAGSRIFLLAAITFFVYSILTTVEVTKSNGIGGTIKYRSPLVLSNFNLYFGIYIALLSCSTILIIYASYYLTKTIQLYLEKPFRDISRNEIRNAKKAILKGIKNGFTEDDKNGWPE